MVWGIIGALNAEVALIKAEMQIEREVELFGTTFYCGTLYGQDAVAVCCSIGKINAAICANTIVREFGADRIINVGIAGSIEKNLGIFDVVVSSELVFHDTDSSIMGKYYPYETVFRADEELAELCVNAIESVGDREYEYYRGRIATGDVFVASGELKESIREKCSPLCVEMEGAAVAQAAFMNRVPFLVVRSMSDSASESAHQLYDNFFEQAAHNSARIVLKMIETQAGKNSIRE